MRTKNYILVLVFLGLVKCEVWSGTESPLLMKILQAVDVATDDDHLFDVTLQLLKSLCVCMQNTLRIKEEQSQFHGDFNSLPNNSNDDKVLDLYKKIYNNTCFNLRNELVDKLDKSRHFVHGDPELNVSCVNNIKNIAYDVQHENEANIHHLSNVHKILHKALIETRDQRNYTLIRRNLYRKPKTLATNTYEKIFIVLVSFTSRRDKTETNTKHEIRFKDVIDSLNEANNQVVIDVYNTVYDSKLDIEPKSVKMSTCNLYSMFTYLTQHQQDHINTLKLLNKKNEYKIYANITAYHYEDILNRCCNNISGTHSDGTNLIYLKSPKKYLDNHNKTVENYKQTVSKIKLLMKQYDEKIKGNEKLYIYGKDQLNNSTECIRSSAEEKNTTESIQTLKMIPVQIKPVRQTQRDKELPFLIKIKKSMQKNIVSGEKGSLQRVVEKQREKKLKLKNDHSAILSNLVSHDFITNSQMRDYRDNELLSLESIGVENDWVGFNANYNLKNKNKLHEQNFDKNKTEKRKRIYAYVMPRNKIKNPKYKEYPDNKIGFSQIIADECNHGINDARTINDMNAKKHNNDVLKPEQNILRPDILDFKKHVIQLEKNPTTTDLKFKKPSMLVNDSTLTKAQVTLTSLLKLPIKIQTTKTITGVKLVPTENIKLISTLSNEYSESLKTTRDIALISADLPLISTKSDTTTIPSKLERLAKSSNSSLKSFNNDFPKSLQTNPTSIYSQYTSETITSKSGKYSDNKTTGTFTSNIDNNSLENLTNTLYADTPRSYISIEMKKPSTLTSVDSELPEYFTPTDTDIPSFEYEIPNNLIRPDTYSSHNSFITSTDTVKSKKIETTVVDKTPKNLASVVSEIPKTLISVDMQTSKSLATSVDTEMPSSLISIDTEMPRILTNINIQTPTKLTSDDNATTVSFNTSIDTEIPLKITSADTETPNFLTSNDTEIPKNLLSADTETPNNLKIADSISIRNPTKAAPETPRNPTSADSETPKNPTNADTETPKDPTSAAAEKLRILTSANFDILSNLTSAELKTPGNSLIAKTETPSTGAVPVTFRNPKSADSEKPKEFTSARTKTPRNPTSADNETLSTGAVPETSRNPTSADPEKPRNSTSADTKTPRNPTNADTETPPTGAVPETPRNPTSADPETTINPTGADSETPRTSSSTDIETPRDPTSAASEMPRITSADPDIPNLTSAELKILRNYSSAETETPSTGDVPEMSRSPTSADSETPINFTSTHTESPRNSTCAASETAILTSADPDTHRNPTSAGTTKTRYLMSIITETPQRIIIKSNALTSSRLTPRDHIMKPQRHTVNFDSKITQNLSTHTYNERVSTESNVVSSSLTLKVNKTYGIHNTFYDKNETLGSLMINGNIETTESFKSNNIGPETIGILKIINIDTELHKSHPTNSDSIVHGSPTAYHRNTEIPETLIKTVETETTGSQHTININTKTSDSLSNAYTKMSQIPKIISRNRNNGRLWSFTKNHIMDVTKPYQLYKQPGTEPTGSPTTDNYNHETTSRLATDYSDIDETPESLITNSDTKLTGSLTTVKTEIPSSLTINYGNVKTPGNLERPKNIVIDIPDRLRTSSDNESVITINAEVPPSLTTKYSDIQKPESLTRDITETPESFTANNDSKLPWNLANVENEKLSSLITNHSYTRTPGSLVDNVTETLESLATNSDTKVPGALTTIETEMLSSLTTNSDTFKSVRSATNDITETSESLTVSNGTKSPESLTNFESQMPSNLITNSDIVSSATNMVTGGLKILTTNSNIESPWTRPINETKIPSRLTTNSDTVKPGTLLENIVNEMPECLTIKSDDKTPESLTTIETKMPLNPTTKSDSSDTDGTTDPNVNDIDVPMSLVRNIVSETTESLKKINNDTKLPGILTIIKNEMPSNHTINNVVSSFKKNIGTEMSESHTANNATKSTESLINTLTDDQKPHIVTANIVTKTPTYMNTENAVTKSISTVVTGSLTKNYAVTTIPRNISKLVELEKPNSLKINLCTENPASPKTFDTRMREILLTYTNIKDPESESLTSGAKTPGSLTNLPIEIPKGLTKNIVYETPRGLTTVDTKISNGLITNIDTGLPGNIATTNIDTASSRILTEEDFSGTSTSFTPSADTEIPQTLTAIYFDTDTPTTVDTSSYKINELPATSTKHKTKKYKINYKENESLVEIPADIMSSSVTETATRNFIAYNKKGITSTGVKLNYVTEMSNTSPTDVKTTTSYYLFKNQITQNTTSKSLTTQVTFQTSPQILENDTAINKISKDSITLTDIFIRPLADSNNTAVGNDPNSFDSIFAVTGAINKKGNYVHDAALVNNNETSNNNSNNLTADYISKETNNITITPPGNSAKNIQPKTDSKAKQFFNSRVILLKSLSVNATKQVPIHLKQKTKSQKLMNSKTSNYTLTNNSTKNVNATKTLPTFISNSLEESLSRSIPNSMAEMLQGSFSNYKTELFPSSILNSMTDNVPNSMTKSTTESLPSSLTESLPMSMLNSITESLPTFISNSMEESLPGSMPNSMINIRPSSMSDYIMTDSPRSISNSMQEILLSFKPNSMNESFSGPLSNFMTDLFPSSTPNSLIDSLNNLKQNFVTESSTSSSSNSMTKSFPSSVSEKNPSSMSYSMTESLPIFMANFISESVTSSIPNSNTGSLPSSVPNSMTESLSSSMTYSMTELFPSHIMPNSMSESVPSSMQNFKTGSLPSSLLNFMTESVPISITNSKTESLHSSMPNSISKTLSTFHSMEKSVPRTNPRTEMLSRLISNYSREESPSSMLNSLTESLPSSIPELLPNYLPNNIKSLPSSIAKSMTETLTSFMPISISDSLPNSISEAHPSSMPHFMKQSHNRYMQSSISELVPSYMPNSITKSFLSVVPNSITESFQRSLPNSMSVLLSSSMENSITEVLPSSTTNPIIELFPHSMSNSMTELIPRYMSNSTTESYTSSMLNSMTELYLKSMTIPISESLPSSMPNFMTKSLPFTGHKTDLLSRLSKSRITKAVLMSNIKNKIENNTTSNDAKEPKMAPSKPNTMTHKDSTRSYIVIPVSTINDATLKSVSTVTLNDIIKTPAHLSNNFLEQTSAKPTINITDNPNKNYSSKLHVDLIKRHNTTNSRPVKISPQTIRYVTLILPFQAKTAISRNSVKPLTAKVYPKNYTKSAEHYVTTLLTDPKNNVISHVSVTAENPTNQITTQVNTSCETTITANPTCHKATTTSNSRTAYKNSHIITQTSAKPTSHIVTLISPTSHKTTLTENTSHETISTSNLTNYATEKSTKPRIQITIPLKTSRERTLSANPTSPVANTTSNLTSHVTKTSAKLTSHVSLTTENPTSHLTKTVPNPTNNTTIILNAVGNLTTINSNRSKYIIKGIINTSHETKSSDNSTSNILSVIPNWSSSTDAAESIIMTEIITNSTSYTSETPESSVKQMEPLTSFSNSTTITSSSSSTSRKITSLMSNITEITTKPTNTIIENATIFMRKIIESPKRTTSLNPISQTIVMTKNPITLTTETSPNVTSDVTEITYNTSLTKPVILASHIEKILTNLRNHQIKTIENSTGDLTTSTGHLANLANHIIDTSANSKKNLKTLLSHITKISDSPTKETNANPTWHILDTALNAASHTFEAIGGQISHKAEKTTTPVIITIETTESKSHRKIPHSHKTEIGSPTNHTTENQTSHRKQIISSTERNVKESEESANNSPYQQSALTNSSPNLLTMTIIPTNLEPRNTLKSASLKIVNSVTNEHGKETMNKVIRFPFNLTAKQYKAYIDSRRKLKLPKTTPKKISEKSHSRILNSTVKKTIKDMERIAFFAKPKIHTKSKTTLNTYQTIDPTVITKKVNNKARPDTKATKRLKESVSEKISKKNTAIRLRNGTIDMTHKTTKMFYIKQLPHANTATTNTKKLHIGNEAANVIKHPKLTIGHNRILKNQPFTTPLIKMIKSKYTNSSRMPDKNLNVQTRHKTSIFKTKKIHTAKIGFTTMTVSEGCSIERNHNIHKTTEKYITETNEAFDIYTKTLNNKYADILTEMATKNNESHPTDMPITSQPNRKLNNFSLSSSTSHVLETNLTKPERYSETSTERLSEHATNYNTSGITNIKISVNPYVTESAAIPELYISINTQTVRHTSDANPDFKKFSNSLDNLSNITTTKLYEPQISTLVTTYSENIDLLEITEKPIFNNDTYKTDIINQKSETPFSLHEENLTLGNVNPVSEMLESSFVSDVSEYRSSLEFKSMEINNPLTISSENQSMNTNEIDMTKIAAQELDINMTALDTNKLMEYKTTAENFTDHQYTTSAVIAKNDEIRYKDSMVITSTIKPNITIEVSVNNTEKLTESYGNAISDVSTDNYTFERTRRVNHEVNKSILTMTSQVVIEPTTTTKMKTDEDDVITSETEMSIFETSSIYLNADNEKYKMNITLKLSNGEKYKTNNDIENKNKTRILIKQLNLGNQTVPYIDNNDINIMPKMELTAPADEYYTKLSGVIAHNALPSPLLAVPSTIKLPATSTNIPISRHNIITNYKQINSTVTAKTIKKKQQKHNLSNKRHREYILNGERFSLFRNPLKNGVKNRNTSEMPTKTGGRLLKRNKTVFYNAYLPAVRENLEKKLTLRYKNLQEKFNNESQSPYSHHHTYKVTSTHFRPLFTKTIKQLEALSNTTDTLEAPVIIRNNYTKSDVNDGYDLRSRKVVKNLKNKPSLLDPFAKTNLYPVKALPPPQRQRKVTKRIQIHKPVVSADKNDYSQTQIPGQHVFGKSDFYPQNQNSKYQVSGKSYFYPQKIYHQNQNLREQLSGNSFFYREKQNLEQQASTKNYVNPQKPTFRQHIFDKFDFYPQDYNLRQAPERSDLFPQKQMPISQTHAIDKIIYPQKSLPRPLLFDKMDHSQPSLITPRSTRIHLWNQRWKPIRISRPVTPVPRQIVLRPKFQEYDMTKKGETRFFKPQSQPLFIENLNDDDFYRQDFRMHHRSAPTWKKKVNYVQEALNSPLFLNDESQELFVPRRSYLPLQTKPKLLRDRVDSIRSYITGYARPTKAPFLKDGFSIEKPAEYVDQFNLGPTLFSYKKTNFHDVIIPPELLAITTSKRNLPTRIPGRNIFYKSPSISRTSYF